MYSDRYVVAPRMCVSRRNAFWNGTYFGCIDYLKKEMLCPPGYCFFLNSFLYWLLACPYCSSDIPKLFLLKKKVTIRISCPFETYYDLLVFGGH